MPLAGSCATACIDVTGERHTRIGSLRAARSNPAYTKPDASFYQKALSRTCRKGLFTFRGLVRCSGRMTSDTGLVRRLPCQGRLFAYYLNTFTLSLCLVRRYWRMICCTSLLSL